MSVDTGLFILRVVVGVLFVGHGAQKLFGWFGGHGIEGTAGWLGSLRLQPQKMMALLVGVVEFGGGLLLVLGLFNPLGPLAIMSSMLVAIAVVHWPKVWVTENGMEYPLVLLTVAFVIGLVGPGEYSLDGAWGTSLPTPETFLVGLAAVIAAVVVILATRGSARTTAEAR